MLVEPLGDVEARQLIRSIFRLGDVSVSAHAQEEMGKDGMDQSDVNSVLRAGVVVGNDYEFGTWRYRVSTPKFMVVVAFESETQMAVVTAWRTK